MDSRGYSTRKLPNILMVIKNHKHASHPTVISNADETLLALQEAFPELLIKKLMWHGLSQKEQISIAQDTDILFSQPGSDVMNALFMPAGSSLLTPCRLLDMKWLYNKKGKEGTPPVRTVTEYGNEIMKWFQAMPDMRSMQICGDEDIKFDTKAYMIPATFNTDNIINDMRVIVDDWLERKLSRIYK